MIILHNKDMEKINIEDIVSIVREAAQFMKVTAFDIDQKDGYENIVTSSDLAVQSFLCEKLALLLPGSGFLCEEEDMQDATHEYTWIIDPIDGTANYARGIAQCAICVGLRHNDEMIKGVVFLPRTEELFTAERGKGAFLNGEKIHTSSRPFKDSVTCTALAVYHKEYTDVCSAIIVDIFKQSNDIRRFGAAAPELCYLAMGRCELYFEYILNPWDYAAASLILEEAGGVICNLKGDNVDCISPSGVLAANNKENLNTLVGIVAKHI